MTDRPPIPVEALIDAAINDGSDYHDGMDAYLSHEFDGEVLTLKFERATDQPNDPDHGNAEHRFRLLGATEETGGEVINHAVDYINWMREEGEADLRQVRDFLTQPREQRLARLEEIRVAEYAD